MQQFSGTRFRLILFILFAAVMISLIPANHAFAEGPYKKCDPDEVHPIWWKAKVNYDITVKVPGVKGRIALDKGDEVKIVSYNRTGPKEIMLDDDEDMIATVPANAVTAYADACTPGDYKKKTKINFVNSKKITSQTDYMIWVSTDMQSLNVFEGSNRNWDLIKSFPCSTGMAGYPTPIGSKTIMFKQLVYHSALWGSNLQYFLSFGGSGIHKWPGPGIEGNIGVHPCSHACVRLGRSAATWMYQNIPVGTRLLVY